MPDDCTACGTCCFSQLENYVAVTGADYARLGDHTDTYVAFDGNRAFMVMVEGHCAALRIDAGRFTCAVYEVRPETCRTLARDSSECAGEIFSKGDRPLVALRRKAEGKPY